MQRLLHVLSASLLLGACAASPGASGGPDGGATDSSSDDPAAHRHKDAGVFDARVSVDASTSGDPGDGTPTRGTCSNTYGSALSGAFGRLDGTITSIVPPKSGSACNADATHVHVQVEMNNAVYDVAINVDGGFYDALSIPLPDGAWAEGWHAADRLDYATTLGIKSTAFKAANQAAMTTWLEGELASANHISVLGTTYTGSDAGSGVHDIHRQKTNEDGAIVLDPLSPNARVLLFRFSSATF